LDLIGKDLNWNSDQSVKTQRAPELQKVLRGLPFQKTSHPSADSLERLKRWLFDGRVMFPKKTLPENRKNLRQWMRNALLNMKPQGLFAVFTQLPQF